VTTTLTRRIAKLEGTLAPDIFGPCFVMAPDRIGADREIARLKTEYGERMPKTLFVMTLADRKDRRQ
jgi:hypothetical protein